MRLTNRWIWFGLAAAVPIALALAQSGSAAPLLPQVVYNLNGEPITLDPTYADDDSSMTVALNCFEGLLRFDNTHRPVAGMATSWRVSTDGLVYRFVLRDALWSNGDPVIANDFVYAWLRALKPGQPSERNAMLFVLANAEAYHKGSLIDPKQVGVRALDQKTLEVKLAKPTGHFLAMVCFPPFLPVNRKVVEVNPRDWSFNPKAAVTNGPYRLVEYRPRSSIALEPNPRYYQKISQLHPLKLTWMQPDEAVAAYKANLLHGLVDPLPDLPGRYLDRMDLRLTFLLINLRRPPLDQLLVRQAMAAAVNREAYVAKTAGEERPAFAVVPPGLPDAAVGKEFRGVGGGMLFGDRDLPKAAKLLAEAGFTTGIGLPELEMIYVFNQKNQEFVREIGLSLAELGVVIAPVPLQWAEYQQRLAKGEFTLARVGWVADYPDPHDFLAFFTAKSGMNYGGYESRPFEEAMFHAVSSVTPDARIAALHRAEDQLAADLPLVPISFGRRVFLEEDRLLDVVHLSIGVPLFYWARMK